MHGSRFVVRDLKEERRHDLPDSCEVGVGRLSVNRLELIELIGEFCHDFLGHHCIQRWSLFVIFGVKYRLWGLKES